MHIDLSPADRQKLTLMAADAGYDSVERFVAEHLRVLAQHPAAADLAPLTQEELQESLAMCDRGMAEVDAGGGRDAREALLEVGRRRGFSLDR